MAKIGLSLEQAPPLSAPLRFFLSAPLFALLAGVLLAGVGPPALASRWSPQALALTHLMTLGFVSMVMLGALFQMLPVLGGRSVPRARLWASLVHALLTVGTLSFAAGFLWQRAMLLRLALVLLGLGLVLFIAVIAWTLARVPARNATISAMRLAVIALLVTLCLGLTLGIAHGWGQALAARLEVIDLHLRWGLLGWVGLLVVGVAFQVVPMFQITPEYPGWITRFLPGLALAGLAAESSRLLAGNWDAVDRTLDLILAAGFALFAVITLSLQHRRRRRLPDSTLWYWRLAMASLLACTALWAAATLVPALGTVRGFPLLLGVLAIVGTVQSVINGMLYKIVPFLVWFHLRGLGLHSVSSMKEVLPDEAARQQFWTHAAALGLLVLAVLWSGAVYPASGAYILSSALLEINLIRAFQVYSRQCREARYALDHRSDGRSSPGPHL